MSNKILITAIICSIPLAADAEIPSFSFVKAGYIVQKYDDTSGKFGGFEFELSYELTDSVYFASRTVSSSNDRYTSTLGFGYQWDLTETSVFYAQIDWVSAVFNRVNADKFVGQGYQMGIGMRSYVTDELELQFGFRTLDAGMVDETFGDFDRSYLEGAASYELTESFLGYLSYETEKDSSRYTIGLRYDF